MSIVVLQNLKTLPEQNYHSFFPVENSCVNRPHLYVPNVNEISLCDFEAGKSVLRQSEMTKPNFCESHSPSKSSSWSSSSSTEQKQNIDELKQQIIKGIIWTKNAWNSSGTNHLVNKNENWNNWSGTVRSAHTHTHTLSLSPYLYFAGHRLHSGKERFLPPPQFEAWQDEH